MPRKLDNIRRSMLPSPLSSAASALLLGALLTASAGNVYADQRIVTRTGASQSLALNSIPAIQAPPSTPQTPSPDLQTPFSDSLTLPDSLAIGMDQNAEIPRLEPLQIAQEALPTIDIQPGRKPPPSWARRLRARINSLRGNPALAALTQGSDAPSQASQAAQLRLYDGASASMRQPLPVTLRSSAWRKVAAPAVLAFTLASHAVFPNTSAPASPAAVRSAARRGANTPSEEIARLADDYWDAMMRWSPTEATFNHYIRYHDRLEDNSASGRKRQGKEIRSLLARLGAIDRSRLSNQEKISRDLMKLQLEMILERQRYKFWQWNVEHMDGPQSAISSAIELAQPMDTEQDARALLARMKAMPLLFQNQIANLKQGLAEGRAAAHMPVQRTINQLEDILKIPPGESPYATAGKRLPKALQEKYLPAIAASVERDVYPAYRAYLRFLKNHYLAKARPNGKPGLVYVPGGRQAYGYMIRYHTTLDKSPDELHQIGLEELKNIHARMRAISKKMGNTEDVAAFMERVRNDPKNFFATSAEIVNAAEDMVARLQAQLPRFFNTLPKSDLVVKPIEPYREENDADAEYHPVPDDLSEPGIYYVNTFDPNIRPRFNLAANTAHEAIPGHHLQIALAVENRELPTFRRQGGGDFFNAFVEGWALYAEGLAAEMGAYPDDLSRLGMLSNDALRACRLVVDTGIHAKGWSRRKAIEFMKSNTPLSLEEIEVEVDRYTLWPGQALAYKAGQRDILALRRELEAKLGPRFDIRAFHEAVLENGALPLPLLRELVSRRSLILAGPNSK